MVLFLSFAMLLCLALARVLSSPAGVVYVDPTGSDAGPGTATAPVASLQAGLAICANVDATCTILATGLITVNQTVTIPEDVQPGMVLDRWPGRPIPMFSGGVAVKPAAWKVTSSVLTP